MKRAFLTLILIATLTSPVFVNAAADNFVDKGAGLIGSGISATTKFLGFDQAGTILDALRPDTKNCNYVKDKLYQPFSGIDSTFPGAETLGAPKSTKDARVTCISVTGGTEGLLRMLFTAGIAVVIALSVIGIAVAGIRYMTEEAVGKKGEAKRKLGNSLIGLFLGLMSYTILYAVNRQLTEFAFNPAQIDVTGAVARGAAEAAKAGKEDKLGVSTGGIEGTMTPVAYRPSYLPNEEGGYTNIADFYNASVNGTAAKNLNTAALNMLGTRTCNINDTNNGRLACAFVVNSIINNALGKPLSGQSNNEDSYGRGTTQMKTDLDFSTRFYLVGTNINNLQPGDIIISPTSTSTNTGHVGIYTSTGRIVSNSSSQAMVDDKFTPGSWMSYYSGRKGLTTYVYRAR